MFIFMEYCADGTISDVAKLGLPESMDSEQVNGVLVSENGTFLLKCCLLVFTYSLIVHLAQR